MKGTQWWWNKKNTSRGKNKTWVSCIMKRTPIRLRHFHTVEDEWGRSAFSEGIRLLTSVFELWIARSVRVDRCHLAA